MSEHDYDEDRFDDVDGNRVDDDQQQVAAEGNRRVGATALTVLEYIAKSIVDDRESVFVDTEEGSGRVTFHVHVAPDDMGRLIGKRGRVAHAIRTVVGAAAHRDGVRAEVEFED